MLSDWSAGEDRFAKVSLDNILHIQAVLHYQGFIQTEMACQQVKIALGGIDVQQQIHRVPR